MNKSTGLKRHAVLIYDANGLKNFWEEIIEVHTKQKEVEDSRLTKSALNKLRCEWAQRLEGRTRMLQKSSEKPEGQHTLLSVDSFQQIQKTVT
ncbi:protein FAM240C-like [Heteronotia binoei]|uniref:protein FAM240C-like n=1 Tax=Heteronotia binoei TaxID=13085 RepID=UPI002930D9E3|nr:protein FAM240C-like [Heteronotia binoei]